MRQAVHAHGEDESARPTQAGLSKVQVQEGGAGLLLFLRQDCTQELGGEPEQSPGVAGENQFLISLGGAAAVQGLRRAGTGFGASTG